MARLLAVENLNTITHYHIGEYMESLKFKTYEELRASMTEEQKAEADALFKKYYTDVYGDEEPIFCGPEARAMAEGPEALAAYYAEGKEWLEEIDLENFPDDINRLPTSRGGL